MVWIDGLTDLLQSNASIIQCMGINFARKS